MKTSFLLLIILLTGNDIHGTTFLSFSSIGRNQQNSQIKNVKTRIIPPLDSLKSGINKADSLPGNILNLNIRIKGYRPVKVSVICDGGPTLEHSPFDLTPEQQDSVKKAQRKITARYKKTPFSKLDKCKQEALMIAKAKLTLLTYAPCYYREGPNVAPPQIGEEKQDCNKPYCEIRFSYDPEQEAHYAYFKKTKLPDAQEQATRYRYCGDIHGGYTTKYLDLYPDIIIKIWTATGEVKDILILGWGWDIGTMTKQELKKIKFRYRTMYIKNETLHKELETQRKQQKVTENSVPEKFKTGVVKRDSLVKARKDSMFRVLTDSIYLIRLAERKTMIAKQDAVLSAKESAPPAGETAEQAELQPADKILTKEQQLAYYRLKVEPDVKKRPGTD